VNVDTRVGVLIARDFTWSCNSHIYCIHVIAGLESDSSRSWFVCWHLHAFFAG